jgi:DNA replication and repair protein RecF
LDPKIHLSHLTLKRFRNFPALQLDLSPGISLLHGANGNGKSNLLEALYLLAVAKSPRAQADRELVGFGKAYEDPGPAGEQAHTVVSATVDRSGDPVTVQIDLLGPADYGNPGGDPFPQVIGPDNVTGDWTGVSFQKTLRVNGAPRTASELIGEVNAVLFSAADLELVYGSPSGRRRYLDILISQHDRSYLRALQRYGRGVIQRNHLLRAIRDGRSNPAELAPWDQRLAEDGGYIVAGRIRALELLQKQSASVYEGLSKGTQGLHIDYEMSFSIPASDEVQALSAALTVSRDRDVAAGHTSVGPHRDDLRILIDGAEAARYASRGQARSAVLALKLAEAEYLSEQRGETPVILLDDVLSELDPVRRELVLDRVSGYDQCLITTAELDAVTPARRAKMHLFEVRDGTVSAAQSDP